jgi:cytokinesis protein
MIIHCDTEVLDNMVVMEFLQKDELCTIPDSTSKVMAPYSIDWTGPEAGKGTREQDPSELTRQDQVFLFTAFELHHYWRSRMRALALTRTFEPEYDELGEKIRHVVSVCESLRDSVSLMNILGLILDIGNFMNDANKQARGFKLSSLARLGMVKDDKNESTLADLIERIVRHQYPEWEGFVEDISGVLTVQKINIEQLSQDTKTYIGNIRGVQSSLDSGNLSDPKKFHPQDRVSQVVQRVMKDARRKAEQMELYLEEMTKTFNDIMVFYGEDPADDNARRDFFAKVASFVSDWKRSREKNVTVEDQRRRNEASMKRKQQAQLKMTSVATESGATAQSTGAMDSLLEKLRAAAPQTKDQRDRRRRARLKDRHQTRVASGQKVPELKETTVAEMGLQDRPESRGGRPGTSDSTGTSGGRGGPGSVSGLLSPEPRNNGDDDAGSSTSTLPRTAEEDDVADRAAALLLGMRDGGAGADGDGAGENAAKRMESMRQARRQTAEEERRLRRRRREKANSTANATYEGSEAGDVPPTPTMPAAVADEGISSPRSDAGAVREVVSPTEDRGSE